MATVGHGPPRVNEEARRASLQNVIGLIAKIEIRDVSSAFAMEQIKNTTELPLDYMVLDKESGSSAG